MKKVYGVHIVQELYDVDADLLNDGEFLEELLLEQAEEQNQTILHSHWHPFEPHGITQFVVLAESHISIHTWPEDGYQSLDVYTCGDHTMPEEAVDYIISRLGCKQNIKTIKRGI